MATDERTGPRRPRSTTHTRVIKAATTMFAQKGYHATGVAEIGDAAGIQRGALYYHIKSKNELLYEIVRVHVEVLIEDAAQIFDDVQDPLERLRLLARSFLSTLANNLDESTLYLREMHSLEAPYDERVRMLRAAYEDYWARAMSQGVEEGVLRSANPIVVKGLIGMFGYTYVWFRPDGTESPTRVADRLLSTVLDGEMIAGE